MKLFLLRHTAVASAAGTCYGRSDVALADSFEQELAALTDRLPESARRPDAVFASPLTRCRTLAERLYDGVVFDERLRELDFGDWEGRAWDALPVEQLRVWGDDYANVAPPGGERFADLQRRAIGFVDEVLAGSYDNVCVISHHGVIVALLSHWLGVPGGREFRIQVRYGGLCLARVEPRWVKIDYINR